LKIFINVNIQNKANFVNQPYRADVELKRGMLEITLTRDGSVWIENERRNLRLQKKIIIDKNSTEVLIRYKLENLNKDDLDLWFGVEFVCNFLAPNSDDRYFYFVGYEVEDSKLASIGEVRDVTSFGVVDKWLGVDMNFYLDKFANVWRFPIETVSLSEAGFERVYQGSVILLHWNIKLSKEWGVEIRNIFRKI
jgi:hypothetical protein